MQTKNPPLPQGRSGVATLALVAARAGVTSSTAHRALHGKSRVSPSTVQAVRKAATEVGYDVNLQTSASRLSLSRTGRRVPTNILGIVYPAWYMRTHAFNEHLRGVMDVLAESQYRLLLTPFEYRLDSTTAEFPAILRRGEVDGIIVVSEVDPGGHTLLRQASGANSSFSPSMVTLNCRIPGYPAVKFDYCSGIRTAVHHLLQLGHRYILYTLQTDPHFLSAENTEPYHGAVQAMEDFGLDPARHLIEVPAPESWQRPPHALEFFGLSAIMPSRPDPQTPFYQALQTHPNATAFITSNAWIARAWYILTQLGWNVPEDFSFVGVGSFDPYLDRDGKNLLSSIRDDYFEAGRTATHMLLNMVKIPGSTAPDALLPTRWVTANSTGPVPASRRKIE